MRIIKSIEVSCFHCHKIFTRSVAEYTRSEKLGRRHFCSRSCCGSVHNQDVWSRNNSGLRRGRKGDEFAPFRYFLKSARYREITKGKTNLTLEYLNEIWSKQGGVCCISGLKMELPKTVAGWKMNDIFNRNTRASLDRIDCARGYVQGNVRFICWMANIARNNGSDEDLISFCKSVAQHQGNP